MMDEDARGYTVCTICGAAGNVRTRRVATSFCLHSLYNETFINGQKNDRVITECDGMYPRS